MRLDSDTYIYIHTVSSEMEDLICSLITYTENAGSELESYHYEVFNEFANEIRRLEIQAVIEVREEFLLVKETVLEAAERIRASNTSKMNLKDELTETGEMFNRLVIRSKNIREFHSSTENPFIPGTNDKVYRVFSKYHELQENCRVREPDTQGDAVCDLMFSFYGTAVSVFERLFHEYDRLFNELGSKVEEKRNEVFQMKIQKKEAFHEIGKAAFDLVKTTAYTAVGIKGKNIFDIGEKGIGLCAKISEQLEHINPEKKSPARSVLKKISLFQDAMELVEHSEKILDSDAQMSGAVKMSVAAALMHSHAKAMEEWKESGSLDVIMSGAKFAGDAVDMTVRIMTGQGILAALKKLPALAESGIGLVEKAAEYCDKKDIHILSKKADDLLHQLAKAIDKYNTEVEQYKVDKLKKKIAVRRPKAPPWIYVKGGAGLVNNIIEQYEERNDTLGFIKGLL